VVAPGGRPVEWPAMNPLEKLTRRQRQALYAAIAVILLLVVTIDDWGRDFTETRAEISQDAPDTLRPFVSDRSAAELEHAVIWAARRIGSWELVGVVGEESGRTLMFVRTQRLFRLHDDIVVRIEDRGSERVVTATSEARLKVGDLGRNPRNLRRLIHEMQDVLAGATSRPAPEPRWT